ncbi:MAG TPA: peptidase M41, partial [Flavobacteriaceae bacterium]|nr:peptidase M41 [Flavobacteriaceae bacterium]
ILQEHKDKLTELATELLEKEVIFKESLERIFGPRPFATPELAEPPKTQVEETSSTEDVVTNNTEQTRSYDPKSQEEE